MCQQNNNRELLDNSEFVMVFNSACCRYNCTNLSSLPFTADQGRVLIYCLEWLHYFWPFSKSNDIILSEGFLFVSTHWTIYGSSLIIRHSLMLIKCSLFNSKQELQSNLWDFLTYTAVIYSPVLILMHVLAPA